MGLWEKHRTEFLTVGLAAVLLLGAAACGGNDTDSSAPGPAAANTATTADGLSLFGAEVQAAYKAEVAAGTVKDSGISPDGTHFVKSTASDPDAEIDFGTLSEHCEGTTLKQTFNYMMGFGGAGSADGSGTTLESFQEPAGASMSIPNSPHCPDGVFVFN